MTFLVIKMGRVLGTFSSIDPFQRLVTSKLKLVSLLFFVRETLDLLRGCEHSGASKDLFQNGDFVLPADKNPTVHTLL